MNVLCFINSRRGGGNKPDTAHLNIHTYMVKVEKLLDAVG